MEALNRAGRRGTGDNFHLKTRTQAEFDIELKLDKPISVEFSQTPLDQAIANLQTLTGLPLVIDRRALEDEKISEVQLITVKPGTAVAAKNVLAFTLEQAGLSYVVEHDLVKVTTTKKSKGRMHTKVFSVADLVTPVPNFALPDYANFDKMLNKTPLNSGNLLMPGLTGRRRRRPTGCPAGRRRAASCSGSMATTPGIQSAVRVRRAAGDQPAGRVVERDRQQQQQARAAHQAHHEHGAAVLVGRAWAGPARSSTSTSAAPWW